MVTSLYFAGPRYSRWPPLTSAASPWRQRSDDKKHFQCIIRNTFNVLWQSKQHITTVLLYKIPFKDPLYKYLAKILQDRHMLNRSKSQDCKLSYPSITIVQKKGYFYKVKNNPIGKESVLTINIYISYFFLDKSQGAPEAVPKNSQESINGFRGSWGGPWVQTVQTPLRDRHSGLQQLSIFHERSLLKIKLGVWTEELRQSGHCGVWYFCQGDHFL